MKKWLSRRTAGGSEIAGKWCRKTRDHCFLLKEIGQKWMTWSSWTKWIPPRDQQPPRLIQPNNYPPVNVRGHGNPPFPRGNTFTNGGKSPSLCLFTGGYPKLELKLVESHLDVGSGWVSQDKWCVLFWKSDGRVKGVCDMIYHPLCTQINALRPKIVVKSKHLRAKMGLCWCQDKGVPWLAMVFIIILWSRKPEIFVTSPDCGKTQNCGPQFFRLLAGPLSWLNQGVSSMKIHKSDSAHGYPL